MSSPFIQRIFAVALASCIAPIAAAQSQVWIQQFGTIDAEHGYGAAADGNGGVFAGGTISGEISGLAMIVDVWLKRSDAQGNQLWKRQFGSPAIDTIYALTSNGAGGVFAVGHTEGDLAGPSAGSMDAWIGLFDGAGNTVWTKQLGSGGLDVCNAVAPDGTGGAYLCGYTLDDLGGHNAGGMDAWVARYGAGGNLLWVRQLGTGETDQAKGAASDGAGGVYICGETWESLVGPSNGYADGWLAHFDAAGTLLWSRQIGTSAFDMANAASPDGAGGVFVAGSTTGVLGGPNKGLADVWVARYDGAGAQQWVTQFGDYQDEWTTSAQFDGSGGMFVCGRSGIPLQGLQSDARIARLDGSGVLLWNHTLGTANENDFAFAAASDGAGGLFVVGDTFGSLAAPHKGWSDAWVARLDGDCNSGTNYCNASATSIPGCTAVLAGTGSPSLAAPGAFAISSSAVPGGNLGICFFGSNGAASTPFGTLGGKICIQAPFFRSAPKPSGGNVGSCNGVYGFTLQDLINASPIVVAGAVIHAEIWARDSANPDGFLLSDGLKFSVCP